MMAWRRHLSVEDSDLLVCCRQGPSILEC